MNLHEDINRIKQMMGLNEDTTPFELFGITEHLVGYEPGPFALYAHLFAKLYKAYRKGNLEKEYEILMSNDNVSRKMVNYFYDFIIDNDEYFQEQEKGVFTENITRVKEGLHDTSWENEEGDKITLMDLLNATEDIPVEKISVEELKPHLLTWDGDEEEIKKIDGADLQYPILIFVNDEGEFISIIDGHHRAQKAVRKGLETIKAKIIPINSLPKDIRKVFSYMN